MDFRPDTGLEAFQSEVREFLRLNLPADLSEKPRSSVRSAPADLKRWQRILNAQGWGAPYWPCANGGTGWSVMQQVLFDEECVAAQAPTQDNFAQKLLGPVLNAFGSPAQIAQHIPRIFDGTCLWCQGFSEPGAGSDLASLSTRAEVDGDHYIVNGQKTWTSFAHEADWIFMLVRTSQSAKKQAGISFLLVDMKSPGISVRPIRSIDNCHHLNETFFDNVRVPIGNRVGGEGDGWAITKFLLNNEHATAADLPLLKHYLRQMQYLAVNQKMAGKPLIARDDVALRLARFDAEIGATTVMVKRVAAMAMEQDHTPAAHALGSMLKIRGTELQQRMGEFLVEMLGDYGAVAYPGPHEDTAEPLPLQAIGRDIAAEMFFRRASTIYGGTSEVQRSIVAKALFQL